MAVKKTAKKAQERRTPAAEAAPAPAGPYLVFARRFRPQSFGDVVGQETTTAALRHALKTGRLAQAYLLSGPRGVGKTSLARIFAKALNCLEGSGPGGVAGEPCNACESCLSIQNGSALDVIEMDAATNRGIGEIRELRENVGLSPAQLRYKVYIVDEVHMLTHEAWNAFLKTLEEPPAHVRFIFATTDPDKIPETILSRCQRFDLRRIGLPDIVKRLRRICEEDRIEASEGALERIAGLAKGGLRDAEGMLDQAVNLGAGKVDEEVVRAISGTAPDELIFQILEACAQGNPAAALEGSGAALEAGADPEDLLAMLGERTRGTLLMKTCGAQTRLLEGQSHLLEAYGRLGERLSEEQILALLQLFSTARRQLKSASQARIPLEAALVRASRLDNLVDLGRLASALESRLAGAPARSAAASGDSRAGPSGVREGPRPNSSGRRADLAEDRPAALPPSAPAGRPAPDPQEPPVPRPAERPEPGPGLGRGGRQTPPRWEEVLAAVRPQLQGGLVAGALGHAQQVQLDEGQGLVRLGYAPAQGFYRESLERPERLALVRMALERVYGKALGVEFVRLEAAQGGPAVLRPGSLSASPARPVPAPEPKARAAAGPSGAVSSPQEELELEYQDPDTLPLEAGGPVGGIPGAGGVEEVEAEFGDTVGEDGEVEGVGGPSRPPPSAPPDSLPAPGLAPVILAPERTRKTVGTKPDLERLRGHPLVEALLKGVDGEIMDVSASR